MQRRVAGLRPLLQAVVRARVPAVVAPQVVAGLRPQEAEVPQPQGEVPLRPQAAAAVMAPQVVAGLPPQEAEAPQPQAEVPLRPQAAAAVVDRPRVVLLRQELARLVERPQQNRTLGKAEAQEMPAAKGARSPSSAEVIMAASGMGQNGTIGAVGGTRTEWANAGSELQSASYGFVAEPLVASLAA